MELVNKTCDQQKVFAPIGRFLIKFGKRLANKTFDQREPSMEKYSGHVIVTLGRKVANKMDISHK